MQMELLRQHMQELSNSQGELELGNQQGYQNEVQNHPEPFNIDEVQDLAVRYGKPGDALASYGQEDTREANQAWRDDQIEVRRERSKNEAIKQAGQLGYTNRQFAERYAHVLTPQEADAYINSPNADQPMSAATASKIANDNADVAVKNARADYFKTLSNPASAQTAAKIGLANAHAALYRAAAEVQKAKAKNPGTSDPKTVQAAKRLLLSAKNQILQRKLSLSNSVMASDEQKAEIDAGIAELEEDARGLEDDLNTLKSGASPDASLSTPPPSAANTNTTGRVTTWEDYLKQKTGQ
jgi:hypothetical protein